MLLSQKLCKEQFRFKQMIEMKQSRLQKKNGVKVSMFLMKMISKAWNIVRMSMQEIEKRNDKILVVGR